MSGGGKTQTSTSSVQIPPEVLARYNAVNARAENVASTPFQAYSYDPNAFVAPMTETQNAAIGQIGQASGMAQPYFQTGAAATLGGMGSANLGELDTNRYMSPYLQNVVQSTADILGQQNRQDMSGALGTAIQSGAGFGDRSGIAAANLNRQQMMGMGSTIGNLLNQGYTQAQGVAQQQQSADLASRQANLARLLQGGQNIGQLGAGAQGAALAGSQALLGAGTQQQQTEQAGKSALYNQYQQERAYPFQTTQFLGNLAMGTGALTGSTTQTTSPAGFFSGFKDGGKVIEGVGYRHGGLVPESMGGHVNAGHMGEGYADGGSPQTDYATMVMQQLFGGMDPNAGAYGRGSAGIGSGGFVPQANLPVGQLMIANPVEGPAQTNASDLVDMASSLTDTGEKAGEMWDKYSPKPSVNPDVFKDLDSNRTNLFSRGGTTRSGLAAGGIPYDPSGSGYVPVQEPGTQKTPELLQPKDPQQPESGLSKVADIAKIVGMFMANGGVAGRRGYATDGAVGEDPKEVLRKKLNEGNTGLSPEDAAGFGQILSPASVSGVAPAGTREVAVTPAVSPTVLPGLKPLGGPTYISLPSDQSGAEQLAEGFGNIGADVRAYNAIQDAIRRSGAPVPVPITPFIDFFTKSSELKANEGEREKTQKMLDWYKANAASLGADPRAKAAAVENPEAYYNERAGNLAYDPTALIGPGLGPVGELTGGIVGPEDVMGQYLGTPEGLAGVSPAGLAGGAALPAPVAGIPVGADPAKATAEPVVEPKPELVAPLDLMTGKPAVATGAGSSENQPLNVRNNNPGNIKDGGFARSQPGYVGNNGEFAVFKTPEDGSNAQTALLGSYIDRGYDTISKIVNRWAPAGAPGNSVESTNNYVAYVAKKAGIDPNQPLSKADIPKILAAQAEFEGGYTSGGGGGGGGGTLGDASIIPPDVIGGGGGGNQPAPGLGGGNFLEQMIAKANGAENIILPFLSGLGKMAGSQSRFLGTALLEGVGGGAEAYMKRQEQLANIGMTQASTEGLRQAQAQKDFYMFNGVPMVYTKNGPIRMAEWITSGKPPTYHQAMSAVEDGTTGGGGYTPPAADTSATITGKLYPDFKELGDANTNMVLNTDITQLSASPELNDPFTPAAARANSERQNWENNISIYSELSKIPADQSGPLSAEVITPFVQRANDLLRRIGLLKEGESIWNGTENLGGTELINKIRGKMASAQQGDLNSPSYSELQTLMSTIPSEANSKEGQAKIVGANIANSIRSLNEDKAYREYRAYLETEKGLTGSQSQFAGRGLPEAFDRTEREKAVNIKKAVETMFLLPFVDINGTPVDAGSPTVFSYLLDHIGDADPKYIKAIRKEFGDEVTDAILEYIGHPGGV